MANESATMNLPMDLIKPAINAHVASAISTALGSSDKIVEKLIFEVMNRKVDERGNPDNYGRGKPWIEWIAEDMVKQSIVDGLKEAMVARKPEIAELISKSLKDHKSDFHKRIISSAVDGLTESLASRYACTIEFKAK